jgi:phosphoribosylformylglycinamidine synthase
MAAVSSLGAKVDVSVNNPIDIFSETFSRAVVEVSPQDAQAFEAMAEGISCEKIGTVGGDEVVINDVCMNMAELKGLYFDTFKKVIEQDI